MTTDEKVDRLEEKYFDLHTAVTALTANVNNLSAELKDFKQEMRDRDNQRHAESLATDAKIADIRNAVDEMGKHVRTLFYTSIAAIAALVFSVLSKG